jgi:hypothetical protein
MKHFLIFLLFFLTLFVYGCNTVEKKPSGIIMEITPDAKIVWKSKIYKYPSCFNKDNKGNLLIADMATSSFYETDKDGNLRWIYPGNNPSYIEKTSENNYLIVNQTGPKSIQVVNSLGEVVDSIENLDNPAEAHIFKNNHYLVALKGQNSIKIYNPDHQILWETKEGLLDSPSSVQALPDDTFLISDYNNARIIEINKDSQILWKYFDHLNHPSAAIRLHNNVYVIGDRDNKRILFIKKTGEIVNTLNNLQVNSISLLPDGHLGVAALKY